MLGIAFLRTYLLFVPDVILRMKSKVLYGRIRYVLHRQVPHIGCDGVLGECRLNRQSLALLHLQFSLKRTEANLLESDVVVFDLHVISDDGAAVPPGKAAVGRWAFAGRAPTACLGSAVGRCAP